MYVNGRDEMYMNGKHLCLTDMNSSCLTGTNSQSLSVRRTMDMQEYIRLPELEDHEVFTAAGAG